VGCQPKLDLPSGELGNIRSEDSIVRRTHDIIIRHFNAIQTDPKVSEVSLEIETSSIFRNRPHLTDGGRND